MSPLRLGGMLTTQDKHNLCCQRVARACKYIFFCTFYYKRSTNECKWRAIEYNRTAPRVPLSIFLPLPAIGTTLTNCLLFSSAFTCFTRSPGITSHWDMNHFESTVNYFHLNQIEPINLIGAPQSPVVTMSWQANGP